MEERVKPFRTKLTKLEKGEIACYQTTKTLPDCKSLQTTILNLMKMQKVLQKDRKTLWEKENLLIFQKTCTADM